MAGCSLAISIVVFHHSPDLLSLVGMAVVVGSSLSIAYAERLRREISAREGKAE